MHQVAPLRKSPTFDDRRRHLRHKPTSIIYVSLGPGNGGIIVNLSAGGASLQAAAKLSAETELALNFRLQGIEQAIETVGYVTWLDPTHKEVGISFKDLPGNTEQQIAKWIASQEPSTWNVQTEREQHLISTARGETQHLPIQASIPVMFPSEKPESAQPSFVSGILPELLSEPPQHHDFGSTPDGMPPPEPVRHELLFRNRARERFEEPRDRPFESSVNHDEPGLGAQSLPVGGPEILPRDCLLPESISPRAEIVAADHRVQAMPDSSASDLRRRRKLAVAVAAGTMGILVLIVIATTLSRSPVGDGSSVQTVQPISVPGAVLPEKAPQAKPTVQTKRTDRTAPSPTGSAGVNAATPVPVMRVAVAPTHQDSGLVGSLRALLGLDSDNKIDPAAAALPVWTVQHSGFYYCAHSPDFRTLEPGAIMTQGQALQSGYQPKLGNYCE